MSTEEPKRINMGSVMAYLSLALAISVQAGTAIWWAGVVNARVNVMERDIAQLRLEVSVHTRDLQVALRQVAVLESSVSRTYANVLRLIDALDARPGRTP